MQLSETQPDTSGNEILKPLKEEYRDFDKTLWNAILDMQTPILQKSLSSGNLETSQDITNIREQLSFLKKSCDV